MPVAAANAVRFDAHARAPCFRQCRLDELTDDKRLAKALQHCLFMTRPFVLRPFLNNPLVGAFVLAPNAAGPPGTMDSIRSVLTPQQRSTFTPVPVELKRGEAVCPHPLTCMAFTRTALHPRRATVHFMRNGTRAAFEESETDGLPAFMTGRTEDRIFYPI
jgi:hypothetical protein